MRCTHGHAAEPAAAPAAPAGVSQFSIRSAPRGHAGRPGAREPGRQFTLNVLVLQTHKPPLLTHTHADRLTTPTTSGHWPTGMQAAAHSASHARTLRPARVRLFPRRHRRRPLPLQSSPPFPPAPPSPSPSLSPAIASLRPSPTLHPSRPLLPPPIQRHHLPEPVIATRPTLPRTAFPLLPHLSLPSLSQNLHGFPPCELQGIPDADRGLSMTHC